MDRGIDEQLRDLIVSEMRRQRVRQSDLVRATGMAPSNLCRYLCGRQICHNRTVERILAALGLAVELRAVPASPQRVRQTLDRGAEPQQ